MTAPLQATVTVLETLAELRALLMAVCPPGPSLHPKAPHRLPDDIYSRERWNGWNQVHMVGVDANGVPFHANLWAYASGHHSLSAGRLGYMLHGALTDEDFLERTQLVFPLQAFPPLPVVLHPEHTP